MGAGMNVCVGAGMNVCVDVWMGARMLGGTVGRELGP